MAKDLYLGLDLGTTGVKAGIFDESGAVLAFARRETPLETTAPGFAEFDASAYAGTVFSCVRELVSAAAVEAKAVRAVGLSSQAETFVILDGRGQPLRKAISWLDVRAEAEARELTGLLPRGQEVNAIASAAKLLWLRKHEPETMRRVRRVLLLPDYLIELLAGRAASDPCTASSTGAYDPWERCWNRPLLDACGLDAGMMPEVLDSGQPAGGLMARAAGELGLAAGALVVVGSNDQLCGALGAGNVAPGSASAALGTALAVIRTSSTAAGLPPGVALLPHPASSAGRRLYGLLAYAKTCGVVLSWFRDTFAPG